MKQLLLASILGILASVFALGAAQGWAQAPDETAPPDDVPDGVQILLPRGGIPAIFEPEFVPASESTLPDDEWIFGVVYEGEARAYSLTLLNHHEIVNDRIGGRPLAAVW